MMRRDEGEFATTGPHFGRERPGPPALSVVVPVFDEAGLIPVLVDRLARTLDALGAEAEVILVDDGSGDGTPAAIARAHDSDPRFLGLSLSRNFGHQLAITAGLAHARGRAVVVMDGDLQDPPEAIGPLWAKLREGYDVVYAVRASRPEGPLKRLAYRLFYRLLNRLGAVEIPRDAGDFGVMSRRVVDLLNGMPERTRFVRGLRAWVGFRQTGIPVDRAPRHAGRPKFTLGKLVGLAVDGVVGFSDAPLRLAGGLGAAGSVASALAVAAGVALGASGAGWPPAWFWVGGMLGVSAGVQLLFLAVLGEYVGRILQEVHGRPLYVVRRRIGLGEPERPRRSRSNRARRLIPGESERP